MDLTPIRVIAHILRHHGVSMCVTGELALNYYNVPRDLEICVPKSSSLAAAGLLCSTGLFEPCQLDQDFNNYTEYKRGLPRVRTTGWANPPQAVVIFAASLYGLDPIDKAIIQPVSGRTNHISKEISHLQRQGITGLPLPRLAVFLKGLAQRYLDLGDDMAMIAVEQLVDGMNLDDAWARRNLAGLSPALVALVMKQISSKASRIDYVSENKVTCFIGDQKEADDVRLIPGFE
ncbi:ser/Thr protein phosphatase [Hirsutella rhossiliensis]|uniref:Ser/Thr protein phosphatase n=1 Tax=Hirsutella rhossiliensis TaxID=111463 RepID=A0A9P8SHC6_9HYPO|nr:ser/Thr protein phosphatase [Hirsutella rhossiliensis]KAH0962701.1 ser/Thr protein phosphatase [Hirsutella rhossiliensis]